MGRSGYVVAFGIFGRVRGAGDDADRAGHTPRSHEAPGHGIRCCASNHNGAPHRTPGRGQCQYRPPRDQCAPRHACANARCGAFEASRLNGYHARAGRDPDAGCYSFAGGAAGHHARATPPQDSRARARCGACQAANGSHATSDPNQGPCAYVGND